MSLVSGRNFLERAFSASLERLAENKFSATEDVACIGSEAHDFPRILAGALSCLGYLKDYAEPDEFFEFVNELNFDLGNRGLLVDFRDSILADDGVAHINSFLVTFSEPYIWAYGGIDTSVDMPWPKSRLIICNGRLPLPLLEYVAENINSEMSLLQKGLDTLAETKEKELVFVA